LNRWQSHAILLSEGSLMTINCSLTESDYRAFRRYVWFRYRKIHWFFAVVMVSLLTLTWFSNKPDASLAEKIAGLVGLIVVWILAMLIFFVIWKLLIHFTGGRFRSSVGPHVFEIGEDTFTESNAQGRHEVRVAGLRRVAETDAHFFVITNSGTYYVVPKRELRDFEPLRALQKRVAGGKS
jgi:hypothetical protein